MYIYTNSLGELGEVVKADIATKLIPDMAREFDAIAEYKRLCEDNRKISTMYGPKGSIGNLGSTGKLEAKVPARLLRAALWLEPDLIKDDAKWNAFVNQLPPICDYRNKNIRVSKKGTSQGY